MIDNDDYVKDIEKLRDDAASNLEHLLEVAKNMVKSAHFKGYIKAKTRIRYNTFGAMYQRADAVKALTHANQGNAANIIVRSMWETMIEYDFINLETSNVNIDVRLATESKQQIAMLRDVQILRAAHPHADTWEKTITDDKITKAIARRQAELAAFAKKYPAINLDSNKTLLSRTVAIDDRNLSKNPDHKTLTQIDYRLLYSTLSGDTHSTIVGNIGNSRMEPRVSLEIRLDGLLHEAPRAAHTAYSYLLRFMQDLNRRQHLKKGEELRSLREIEKQQNEDYQRLQRKYDGAF